MKNFFPILLVFLLLFVILKSTGPSKDKIPKTELQKKKSDSLHSVIIPKELIFFEKFQKNSIKRIPIACLIRLQPSYFKAHCYFNCKLLSSSKNSLCFFPSGLSLPDNSKPRYDKEWKRQFIQYC